MSIVNTNLTEYIGQDNGNVTTDLFYSDFSTSFAIEGIEVEPGCYPSKLLVDFSDTELVYGTGTAIKTSDAAGTDTVEDFEVKAVKISAIKGFSQAAMDKSIIALGRRNKIDPAELSGESIFLDLNGKTIVQDNELRIWQGATNSATAKLVFFDGIVKQVIDATDATETGATSNVGAKLVNATAVAEVYSVIEAGELLLPQVINQPAGAAMMFMSPANFATFKRAYFELTGSRNADKLTQGSNVVNIEFEGTSTMIYSMSGLSGSNEILWTRAYNFGVPTDFEGAIDSQEFWYSQDEAEHFLRSIFALGAYIKRTSAVVRRTAAV